ncbi:MAG TPA: imelysin family protein [Candidatus Kapabacteria bacterium]|nr:imelysin family protein [Candidatus Kapabacteria bacterium]
MKKYLLLLCVFAFLTGCEDDAPIDDVTNADREVMLRSLAENVIVPGFAQLNADAVALNSAVIALNATPSQTTLVAAQNAWLKIAKAWKRLEVYQQGILDVEHPDSLIHKIDIGSGDFTKRTEPTDTNALNVAIAGLHANAQTYVESMPATLQGLTTMEHLLFTGGTDAVLARLANNNAKSYLEGLTASVVARTARIANAWDPANGNFSKSFAENYGNDIGSSLGMLINDMITIAEVIKNEKISRPMGLTPERVEARPSEQSIAMIVENINGLETAFTADADSRTGKGIDDVLRSIDAKVGDQDLVDAVMTQFDRIRASAGEINAPLHIAVTTERAKVTDLLNQVLTLIKLLKADVMVELGVMLTGFEGDGD